MYGSCYEDMDVIEMVRMMLIMCLCSVAHGLSPMVLLLAPTPTPGLNDNSPSHLHNQILSLDMVRPSMLPRLKKETYI